MSEDTTAEETTPEEVEIKDPKAVLEALERAKNDAKKYREELAGLLAEKDALQERLDSLSSDDLVTKWKDKARDLAIDNALREEGIAKADRVRKFLSVEDITMDDDGNLEGFKESMTKVKTDLPELFDEKKRVGGSADLFAKGDVAAKKSGTEMQVERILGRS